MSGANDGMLVIEGVLPIDDSEPVRPLIQFQARFTGLPSACVGAYVSPGMIWAPASCWG